jgi:hypothetical protein
MDEAAPRVYRFLSPVMLILALGAFLLLFQLDHLVIAILTRYCRRLWSSPGSSALGWYRVLVVLGFAIHSLSYDSLLFPPVNCSCMYSWGSWQATLPLTAPGRVINPAPRCFRRLNYGN